MRPRGNREQVGLVRVISDYATFAYLCDVYVIESHRGRGLSKAALRHLASHPRLQDLRRMQLVTYDAQGLYAQFGFRVVEQPERHMEKRAQDPAAEFAVEDKEKVPGVSTPGTKNSGRGSEPPIQLKRAAGAG